MTRILLVDDSLSILAAISQSLKDHGYEVTCTNSGADALCLLKNRSPSHLLILDLSMPGVDGYKVLSELGLTCPPILIITGNANDLSEELKSGKVARVLIKPFDQTALLATIEEILEVQNHKIFETTTEGATVQPDCSPVDTKQP